MAFCLFPISLNALLHHSTIESERLPVHTGFDGEATQQVTEQVGTKLGLSGDQVLVLSNCAEAWSITDLMALAGRANRTKFREAILDPLLEAGLVEMTQPDSPRSPTQKYRLTDKGRQWLAHKQ